MQREPRQIACHPLIFDLGVCCKYAALELGPEREPSAMRVPCLDPARMSAARNANLKWAGAPNAEAIPKRCRQDAGEGGP
jgi:hypothetical protein